MSNFDKEAFLKKMIERYHQQPCVGVPYSDNWELLKDVLDEIPDADTRPAEIEQIRIPCKLGDMIYVIIDGKICSGEVYHIGYSDYYGKVTTNVWTKEGIGASFEQFGKCAFLSREEAEAALEKQKGQKNGDC